MIDGILSPDIFAKRPQLRLPNGQTKYNTFFGWCFTMLYFAILVGFIFLCTMGMLEIDKNHMTSITKRDTLKHNIPQTIDIAYKVVDPSNFGYELDPAIASLNAYQRVWDL